MPIIATVEDAKKLRDRIKSSTSHARLNEWRKVRDRRMDDMLAALKQTLPQAVQEMFGGGYQTAEPEEEINDRKHILVSNPVELEVVARSGDSHVITLAQSLEKACAAILDALFPQAIQLLECDSILGDGRLVLALDKLPAAPDLSKYADRPKLQHYAETTEEDDDEGSAEARYRRAHKSNEGDHQKAYAEVCDEAEMAAGLRYRIRVVDMMTFGDFRDDDQVTGISIGCEYGRVPLAPVLQALSNYGLERVGDEIKLTRDGKVTDQTAVGVPVMPIIGEDSATAEDAEMIDYTQIRTREGTYVLLEHPKLTSSDGTSGAGLISSPNFYGPKSTGYYQVGGIEKVRGNDEDRFIPPVIGILVEAMEENVAVSVWRAMALEEATRDVYSTNNAQPGVPPLERSQRTSQALAKGGQPQPVAGSIERTESTGVKIAEYIERIERTKERYCSNEFFSGTGLSGEPALHLARLQTAFLTKMVSYQTKRAEARKAILTDILYDVKNQKRAIFVPWMPEGERGSDEKIRVAKPMQITPEMAGLPVVVAVIIGAESPETEAARQMASRQEVDAGFRSPETHMKITGVKDPADELKRIAKGGLIRDAIVGADGAPGWASTMFRTATEKRIQQWVDAKVPPPPPPPPPVEIDPLTGLPMIVPPPPLDPMDPEALPPAPLPGGAGATVPGTARFTPPVQTVNGAAVAPGVPGVPV